MYTRLKLGVTTKLKMYPKTNRKLVTLDTKHEEVTGPLTDVNHRSVHPEAKRATVLQRAAPTPRRRKKQGRQCR